MINNGQITVTGSAVPEPSSIVTAATALLIAFAAYGRTGG
jgi:hypothetical protein